MREFEAANSRSLSKGVRRRRKDEYSMSSRRVPVREFEAGGDSRSLSKGVPRLRAVDDEKKRRKGLGFEP